MKVFTVVKYNKIMVNWFMKKLSSFKTFVISLFKSGLWRMHWKVMYFPCELFPCSRRHFRCWWGISGCMIRSSPYVTLPADMHPFAFISGCTLLWICAMLPVSQFWNLIIAGFLRHAPHRFLTPESVYSDPGLLRLSADWPICSAGNIYIYLALEMP